jgi:lipopolysaccharide biosynthesis protein
MHNNLIIPGLIANWTFKPSVVARWERRKAIETMWEHAHKRPTHKKIKAVTQKQTWVVYFMYSPDGLCSTFHRFTLERLRDIGIPVFVVCATPSPDSLPQGLSSYCDALYWKGLAGYDFSGYTLALREISRRSPGADVLVMNDSVFGPFSDLREVIAKAPWDLTGFTASNQLTNHIQSYAFILRGVNKTRMAKLSTVFFPYFAMSNANAVICLQETRLARVAARHMKVGALWYGDCDEVIDPTLVRPLELLDAGFPFLKRSLISKQKSFISADIMRSRLELLNHPMDSLLESARDCALS